MNTDEYLRGMNDCSKGRPHMPNQSKDYDNGYATQYEAEQIQDQMTEWGLCNAS